VPDGELIGGATEPAPPAWLSDSALSEEAAGVVDAGAGGIATGR
jgi:hypothetical protein